MKGIDILIKKSFIHYCPSKYGFKDVNRQNHFDEDWNYICKHAKKTNESEIVCMDCVRKSLELEYEESEGE